MLRSMGSSPGRVFLLVALAAVISAGGSATASASVTVNCANLQSELDAAGSSGETLVLSELCSGPYTLPAGAAFTLQGASGATGGFDGNGLTQPQLSGTSVAALTLSHLTFQDSQPSSEGALVLSHSGGNLLLEADQFLDDASAKPSPVELIDDSSGCPSGEANGSLTIANSVFEGDTGAATSGGLGAGGGLLLDLGCGLDATTLSANTFTANQLKPAAGQPGSGGGLAIFDEDANNIAHVTQTGNVFNSNAIVADGTSYYVGAGEQAVGVDLASTGDRFSDNTLPGSAGAEHYSWGAGLSIEQNNCQATSPQSTLINDVVAANSIHDSGSEEPAEAVGAGIYVGVLCEVAGYSNSLTLLDSTVTENGVTPAGEGAVAGIDGHPSDHLTLDNSILYGDVGGAEIGGFTGAGGSLTATYSDVCSGSSPLPGAGNICANPLLADNGNPESFDVHETSSSPTIDAGSVGLIPSGLATDAFGDARTQVRPSCGPSLPAGVDMGADEYVFPAVALPCPPPHNPAVPGLTKFIKLKTSKHSVAVTLGCTGASSQICSGLLVINDARSLSKQKVIGVTSSKQESKPIKLGESTFSLAGGHTVTITVKLNSTGVSLLHRLHSLPTVVLGSEAMPKESVFLFLFHAALFTEPKHKAHKHKKRHHHKKRHPKKHH